MKEESKSRSLLVLGPQGSFSDQAARKIAGRTWKMMYALSFDVLFANLKPSDYALVPVKNKIIGEIPPVAAFFKKHPVKIVKKFRMPVSFVLAAKEKVAISDITDIYVSRVAKEQCGNFIKKKLSHVILHLNINSTSAGCKKVAQLEYPNSGAIASLYAAKLYGLKILAKKIENEKNDWTEFILFTLQEKQ